MMEKIILTQEQYEAIERLKKQNPGSFGWIYNWKLNGMLEESLNCIPNADFERVLFVLDSYVVEKTEEVKKTESPISVKEEREKSLQETMQDGINAIKQLASVLGENVRKNMQANFNTEITDVGKLMEEMKKNAIPRFIRKEQNDCQEHIEKEQEHLNHPFYKKVDEITEQVAMQQILKGAEKYPEPFNPASWTGEQLVQHGLQEARDLQVYLVGLAEHIERIEKEKFHLQDQLEVEVKRVRELREIVNEEKEDKNKWYKEAQRWMKENESLRVGIEEQKGYIKNLERTKNTCDSFIRENANELREKDAEIERLKEERDFRKEDGMVLARQLKQVKEELKATCDSRDHWRKAFQDCEKDFQELKELRK